MPVGYFAVLRYFRPDNDASNNAANRESNAVINSLNVPELSIHRRQTHDAFGAVSSETDGLGNTTTFTYNTLGLMTLPVNCFGKE